MGDTADTGLLSLGASVAPGICIFKGLPRRSDDDSREGNRDPVAGDFTRPRTAYLRVLWGPWGEYSSSSESGADSKAIDHRGHNLSRAVMGPGWLPGRAERSPSNSNTSDDDATM